MAMAGNDLTDPALRAFFQERLGARNITRERLAKIRRLYILPEGESRGLPEGPDFISGNPPAPVRDLGGLEQCVNLERLRVVTAESCDISALSELPRLEALELAGSGTQTPDLAVLERVPALHELCLHGFRISAEAWRLPGLQKLTLGNCEVEDLSVFSSFPELSDLRLIGERFPDLAALPELRGLRTLFLLNRERDGAFRPVRKELDLAFMKELPGLKWLRLEGFRVNAELLLELIPQLHIDLQFCDLKEKTDK